MSTLAYSPGSERLISSAADTRPFGRNSPHQSRVYLMYWPFLLMASALFIALVPTNTTFVFGAFVGGLAGLYLVMDLVFNEPPLRISSLLAMSLLVAYNLGALNSWLAVPRGGLSISEYFARDPAILANGIAACLGVGAALLFAGQLWERPIFGRDFCLTFGSRSLLMILLSTALILAALATGQVGYMGLTADVYGHVSAFASIVAWWLAPSLAYSVCAALNTQGLTRLVVGLCAIIQTAAIVPTGRRNFAFALLLSVIASRLGRFRLRLSVIGKFFLLVSAAVLIVIASLAFFYLRFAGWEHKEATTLGARVKAATDLAQTRSLSDMTEVLQSNTSSRTFIVAFFSDLLDASQKSTPLLGSDLMSNLRMAVPSAISADKLGPNSYGEEQQANMQWGFSYIDEANSIITAGAADFGLIGVFVYPFLVVLILRSALEWIQFSMPTYVATMIALAYIFQMLLAESLPVDYLIQIRNTIILAAIFYILAALPKFRLSTRAKAYDRWPESYRADVPGAQRKEPYSP